MNNDLSRETAGYRYESVTFVGLYWDGPAVEPTLQKVVREEINTLLHLFSTLFNYEAFAYPLATEGFKDSTSFQRYVEDKIVDTYVRRSRGSDLLILYYGGHGSRKGEFTAHDRLTGDGTPGGPYLDGPALLTTVCNRSRGDFLFISDSCHSGALGVRSQKWFGSAELLAACPRNRMTPSHNNNDYKSFTHNLIPALTKLAQQGPFSTAELRRELIHTAEQMRETPQLDILSRMTGHEHIWLHKLEPISSLNNLHPPRDSFPSSLFDLPPHSFILKLRKLLLEADPNSHNRDGKLLLRICQLEHNRKLKTSQLNVFAQKQVNLHTPEQKLDVDLVRNQLITYMELFDWEIARSIIPQQFDASAIASARKDPHQHTLGIAQMKELKQVTAISNSAAKDARQDQGDKHQIGLYVKDFDRTRINRTPLVIQHLPARWNSTNPRTIEFIDKVDHNWELLVDVRLSPLDNHGKEITPLLPRVQKLCNQLDLTSREEFHVFDCVGYVGWREAALYGLVYTRPEGFEGKCETFYLRSLLGGQEIVDKNINEPRSRRDRVGLALALARSIGRFHFVGWLHKGLRSSNVLFLARCSGSGSKERREITWSSPKIVGLGYGRFVADATSRREQWDPEINAHQHPSRWGKPMKPYTKLDDYYSLGVMMLEIAIWCHASDLARDDSPFEKMKPDDVKAELLSVAKKELSCVGSGYQSAAITCLQALDAGSFLNNAAREGEATLHEAFKKHVIDNLAPKSAPELVMDETELLSAY